jgi:PAS domain S-box-containing protein
VVPFITQEEIEVILNSTYDGMIAINKAGIVTLFNASAERLMELECSRVIGRQVMEVIPNTRLLHVLETGVAQLNQQQSLGKITIHTNRVPVKDQKGEVIGAVAIFRDITDVKIMAEELTDLREVQQFLQAIINATDDAISVVDEKGIGILINPAYTRITGLNEEDVLNKPATVDIAEGDSIHMQVLKTRQAVRGVKLKVGPTRKEVVVNVAPIIINHQLKGSVGIINDFTEIKKLTEELEQFKRLIRQIEAKYSFDDIIGDSEEMMAAKGQALRAAATPATVILRGESGTGKELFAHAIHNASNQHKGRFVRVNCASLSENLLESELFGYEAGAFTGALKGGKKGLFEEAHGGTIFLDEIGEINLNMQTKLLRVLQEKELVRVGGTKPISVNVRVIGATNANLEKKVEEGSFRADLYYRLNVVPIFIPPLNRRKDDIGELAKHIISKFNQEYGRNIKSLSTEALEVLKAYHWPGNVRELENVLGRAIINMRINEDIIKENHLPFLDSNMGKNMAKQELVIPFESPRDMALDNTNYDLEDLLSVVEKDIIIKVLNKYKGNKTKTAKALNISIRNLYYKLDKYQIS